jgi:signal transduction histidine kinase
LLPLLTLAKQGSGGGNASRYSRRDSYSHQHRRPISGLGNERLIKEAHRASNIVDGLRDLARKTVPRMDAFDLNDAILEVVALTHGAAVKIGVTVRTQLARLPPIQGDRVQLQQVMLNLIVNAIQAMSSVTVGARDLQISTEAVEEASVRVGVRDTGPGLSTESLERLFDGGRDPFRSGRFAGRNRTSYC